MEKEKINMRPVQIGGELFYTVDQLLELFKCSYPAFWVMRKDKNFPLEADFTFHRKKIWSKTVVENWIKEHMSKGVNND